ncbi:MAG: hypothetical protein ACXAC7_17745 [Candidatus Hodarchaeales archaeon]|jgi:hypothetical protein
MKLIALAIVTGFFLTAMVMASVVSIQNINLPKKRAVIRDSPIIADHTSASKIMNDDIPADVIENAKNTLHVAYQHTSHGSQITTGMGSLAAFKESKGGQVGLYEWYDGIENGSLDLDDYCCSSYASNANDVGYTGWSIATRNYLNDANNADVNVVMWSWCGQVDTVNLTSHYFEPMEQLEVDFPDVMFVYMTGHHERNNTEDERANEEIRAYVQEHNKILYDFTDIETYDPDGNYYGDRNPGDDCSYTKDDESTGNWCQEWRDAHPDDWYSCSSAHSYALNANLKAYAAWWLWATLAGYSDVTTGTDTTGTTSVDESTTGTAIFTLVGIMAILVVSIRKRDR